MCCYPFLSIHLYTRARALAVVRKMNQNQRTRNTFSFTMFNGRRHMASDF